MATLKTVQVKVRPVIDLDGSPVDVFGFAVLKPGDRVLLTASFDGADEAAEVAKKLNERFPEVQFTFLDGSFSVVGIEHGEGA